MTIRSILPLLLIALTTKADAAEHYYLSSSTGADSNSGSQNSPWMSLDKISATELEPGDIVYFKRGDRFDGHFVVNGSGAADQPILITAYGDGPQPIITGEVGAEAGGDYQEAILVNNHDHMVFDGLEVQNERITSRAGVDDKDAFGIRISNTGNEVMRHFTFRNMTFRNIFAPQAVLREDGEDSFNQLVVSGVTFFSSKNKNPGNEKHIRDVLMEDCYFENIQRLGVHMRHQGGIKGIGDDAINRNMNFVFRNNEFHHLGGTCILPTMTYNCLIEHNLFNHPGSSNDPRMPARGSSVWTWRSHNTVIQHNTCLSTRGYLDSHGIHIDHQNVNTFIQYNYMEDCEGGFVEILGGNVNAVYRFNISVNDGWRDNPKWKNSNHTVWINNKTAKGIHHCDGSYIYNNTIYMDRDFSTAIEIDAKNTYIYNNIFHVVKGSIGGKTVKMIDNDTDLLISNNLFRGEVSSRLSTLDANHQTGNPRLIAPETRSKSGYQLEVGSAAIDNGLPRRGPPIPGAGSGIFKDLTEYPTVDFYGNPVDLSTGTPNIGACNAKRGELIQSQPKVSPRRNFSSKDGRSIDATLLSKDEHIITIRRTDGLQFEIHFDHFSSADQRYINNWFRSIR